MTFQRLAEPVPGNRRLGLGLAIATGFVDARGGEPTLDDTPGAGATFPISLPAADPPTARTPEPLRTDR
jgi:K+-sensing histidine kinase KdpD